MAVLSHLTDWSACADRGFGAPSRACRQDWRDVNCAVGDSVHVSRTGFSETTVSEASLRSWFGLVALDVIAQAVFEAVA